MAADLIVTTKVTFGNPDGDSLPLLRCVCGHTFERWTVMLHMDSDDPDAMSCCGRRLYFQNAVQVIEARDDEAN